MQTRLAPLVRDPNCGHTFRSWNPDKVCPRRECRELRLGRRQETLDRIERRRGPGELPEDF